MIKVLISGANGKMGQTLAGAIAKTDGMEVCCGIDLFPDVIKNDFPVYKSIRDCAEKPDVIIDFSRPEALSGNLEYAIATGVPVVIATTGLGADEKAMIVKASQKVAVFFAANMSLGVNLQMELCRKAAELLGEAYDIEIIEKHHNQKVDAPSGTAFALAEYINGAFFDEKDFVYGRHSKTEKRGREIGIHAVRGGTFVGEHDVIFAGTDEVIEINHISQSKQIFAYGALKAAEFIVSKPAGLYNMNSMLSEQPVTKVNTTQGQAMITLSGLKYSPAVLSEVFTEISKNGVTIDMISQTAPSNGQLSLSVTMDEDNAAECLKALKTAFECDMNAVSGLAKLSVEGTGMKLQSGVASKLFDALAKKGITIYIISTSETMIGFCVDSQSAKSAHDAVTQTFDL